MISYTDLQTLRDSFAAADDFFPVEMCRKFAELLGVSEVSICLFSTADQFTIGASSEEARLLDDWAHTFQEGTGPGATDATSYCVSDTASGSTSDWPRLSSKAHAMGYRSLASIPLRHQSRALGTIQLHHREGIIENETVDDAERVAVEVVALLTGPYAKQEPAIGIGVDRHEFHQATGMVMHQFGVAASAAAQILRAFAWAHDLTLLEVAQGVVSRSLAMAET